MRDVMMMLMPDGLGSATNGVAPLLPGRTGNGSRPSCMSSINTAPNPAPMADHACGPAAHAVPAKDVVQGGPSKTRRPPYVLPWPIASEQAGRCRPLIAAGKGS